VEPERSPAPDMADSTRSPQPRSGMAGRSGYLPVSEHGLIGDPAHRGASGNQRDHRLALQPYNNFEPDQVEMCR
jgi:hypothetical protein